MLSGVFEGIGVIVAVGVSVWERRIVAIVGDFTIVGSTVGLITLHPASMNTSTMIIHE
jgi:2-succinyl-5-enolpyruvyl-6-hydroxy-3-cyclohexene-1-carboxylate synthase